MNPNTIPPFRFDLESTATIKCSGETGEVIGRAQYAHSESSYLIRYKNAEGRAVENWWPSSALDA